MAEQEKESSFYDLFYPLTTKKAISFIFLIGFIVYFYGLFNGFVSDDNALIINNPYITSVSFIPKFFFESHSSLGQIKILGVNFYRPIIDSLYVIINLISGMNPSAYHLVQTILVLTNASLLFLVLKKFFKINVAFLLSILFLIHPINSEVAYYIADTADVLFFLFGISAFLILINTESKKAILLSFILMFLSLLSKETGILFILVSVFYVILFKRKLFATTLSLSLVTLFIWGGLRMNAIGLGTYAYSNAPIQRLDLVTRITYIPSIVFFYIKELIFPKELSMSYQWVNKGISIKSFYLPLIIDLLFFAVISIFGYLVFNLKNKKIFSVFIFFCFWFLIGLVIHLQFFPLDETVAERYFYFSFVGVLGMLGILIENFRINLKKPVLLSVVLVIIVLLSARTFIRGFDWKDDYVLASHDINVSKNSYVLNYIISTIYLDRGNFPEARKYALASVESFPYIINYTNLGAIYVKQGNYEKAKEAYLEATKYGDDQIPYDNLAELALMYGDQKENIKFLNSVVEKYPTDYKLWFSLAILEYINDRKKEARLAIEKAKLYSTENRVLFIYNIISNDKPLELEIKNGQINVNTSK